MLELSPKRPSEVLPGCYLDFSARLAVGETIEHATVTSSVAGMIALGSVAWTVTKVSWTATGGMDGDRTVYTVTVTGSLGSVLVGEVALRVTTDETELTGATVVIQIPAFNTSVFSKVNLTADCDAGDTSLVVGSVEGFKSNGIAVLGVPNSSTAEFVYLGTISANNALPMSACKYAHRKDEEYVGFTLYDRIKIYRGTAEDISTHELIAVVPMELVRNVTVYSNFNSSASNFYSYSYYNNINESESLRVALIGTGLPLEITPDYVRNNYLYGLDLTDDNGNPLPDSVYWEGILAAYHWMEQRLQIDLIPRTYTEYRDFRPGEYQNWCFLQTDHYPIQAVTAVNASYYGSTVVFPMDWVRTKNRMGVINLVPGGTTFASFMIPAGGGILPVLNSAVDFIPNFWVIQYRTGFANNSVPYNLRDIICKRACFMPLNILGDLVGGVAIASKSIGIDGLSQSINTTNSAENAGYSGRLRQYERELKSDLPALEKYWRRVAMTAI